MKYLFLYTCIYKNIVDKIGRYNVSFNCSLLNTVIFLSVVHAYYNLFSHVL